MRDYILCIIVFLTLLLAPSIGQSANCSKHPIYCHMLRVKPSIDKRFAMRLSNYIARYSKKHRTDPHVSVAIAMQESSLRNVMRKGVVSDEMGNLTYGLTDIGIFQLHVKTIQHFNINFERLLVDMEYQVKWHVLILKHKIKVCKKRLKKKEQATWACYHSYSRTRRARYQTDVERYL